ncbi:MAG: hypothetical protein Q8K36_01825, partial [Alphaproteobacteria bacterium]|nr:hypothetical protein [Alphaproteobacteria bacterium]
MTTVNLKKLSFAPQQYPTFITSLRGKTFLYALPFMLWATFTCAWSPHPMNSLTAALGFITLIICSLVYAHLYKKIIQDKHHQWQIIQYFLVGGFVIALLVLLDYFMGGWWVHYKNTSTAKVYVKLALSLSFMGVVGLHFIKRIPYKILYMLVIFCALQRMDCDTALLAYLVGLVCYGAMSFSLVTKIIKYSAIIGLPLVMLT